MENVKEIKNHMENVKEIKNHMENVKEIKNQTDVQLVNPVRWKEED